uniref:Endo/exonuclease/phosphatase domain-containing protein n=1 Tax=Panagrellus redivivus TaxID=6233 RepID=A0A7E4UY11_PANRE
MTFNIWNSGANVDRGLYKIAKHIRIVDADVIAIQEVQYNWTMSNLLSRLGPGYYGYAFDTANPNTGIITKHEIDLSTLIRTSASVGFKITLLNSKKSINFYSLHLTYRNYGPYAANYKNVVDSKVIDLGEKGRVANVQAIIDDPGFQAQVQSAASGGIPLIVAGDFNSPSHLDWIESTKHLHGDWVYEWPANKLISDNASLTDSFRAVNPDPLCAPGNTWSTVHKSFTTEWEGVIPDVYDRIDFILFNSPKLIPVDSFIYSGSLPLKPQPKHFYNDYPSDHFAVVTDFLYQ